MSQHPTLNDVAKAEKLPRRRLKGAIIEPADIAKVVASLGGINYVVQKRKWQAVRELLKLPQTSSSGNTLYRVWKLYFPKFDGLSTTVATNTIESSNSDSESSSSDSDEDDDDSESSNGSSNSSSIDSEDVSSSSSSSDEDDDDDHGQDNHGSECEICKQPGELLCCDHCTRVFHIHCLTPPLKSSPQTNWKCPVCIKNNNHKRPSKPLPQVEQSTFSYSMPSDLSETIARLGTCYQDSDELESWEFDLTKLMLQDRSLQVKSGHVLALVQAALDDYELSQMAVDLSHTLSRVFLSVYEIGWHMPKRNSKKRKR
jgi:hypothetical protein